MTEAAVWCGVGGAKKVLPYNNKGKHPVAKKGTKLFVSGLCLTRRRRQRPATVSFLVEHLKIRKQTRGESWIIYKPRRIEKRVQYIYLGEAKTDLPRPPRCSVCVYAAPLFIFSFSWQNGDGVHFSTEQPFYLCILISRSEYSNEPTNFKCILAVQSWTIWVFEAFHDWGNKDFQFCGWNQLDKK